MKVVHRDVKPQNILVAAPRSRSKIQQLRVLISDFGLGKRLADDQSSFHNTIGFGGGTAGWRAPESLLALSAMSTVSRVSSGESDPDTSGQAEWTVHSPGRNNKARPSALVSAAVLGSSKLPSGCSTSQVSSQTSANSASTRITRMIDIFSCGCVFFYVLTSGGHPFGEKFAREVNVLRGNHRLDALDMVGEDSVLAKDLIRRMIAKDPNKRPDATAVLAHPYFWSPSQRLSFLQDVSDRFEPESKDPPSPLVKFLERGAAKVTNGDWCRRFDRSVIEDLGKYRKYDGASIQDLLRALRNKRHHYQDLSPAVKKLLGSLPDGFLSYFESRFPLLLLHCYNVVAEIGSRGGHECGVMTYSENV
eukprot:jgi/Hompol1/406/HPOL_003470-RA